jgi:hypothetical protein
MLWMAGAVAVVKRTMDRDAEDEGGTGHQLPGPARALPQESYASEKPSLAHVHT